VRAVGILEPLVVVSTDDGSYRILAGHRRCRAAIEAGLATVPCVVRDDLAGQATEIAGMLVENCERSALKVGERAAGYEQLAALGLTNTAIAKATGASRAQIVKGREVAASDIAGVVADRYGLTLDQAVVLAEFDDDGDDVKALTLCAKEDPARFDHLASRLRQDRQRRQQHDDAVAALSDAGVRVLEEEPAYGYTDLRKVLRLDGLCHDGKNLTPTNHASCPGHAAYVSTYRPERPEYVCTNPQVYGHTSRYGSDPDGPSSEDRGQDDQRAERRQVIENNKAWRAAEPVRRQFTRDLLARKAAPKGTLRFVVTELLAEPERFGDGKDELLADLLGTTAPGGWRRSVGPAHAARLAEARLPLALLAQLAADRGQTMGVHTWRQVSPASARWLTFLASAGYVLADIEQCVVDRAAQSGAGADAGEIAPEPPDGD
jgi:ParB family chromosome partitioning protein